LKTAGNAYSYRFVAIAAVFVACLITANIIIVKQVSVFGIVLPSAIVIFPLSYVFGDILTEVYGYRRARQVIWLGFLCNLIAVTFIWLAQILPPAAVFDAQNAYERILGSTPRFLLASFLAYLAGEFTNSYIMAKMKILTKGRWLWSRTIGSTFAGQAADTAIVLAIAFGGVLPLPVLAAMGLSHWGAKILYEALITPLTYAVVNRLKRTEGIDTYDYDTDFNPLRVT
jgi:uncharacterized integral membrane protein (TIGR00697 family)